MDAEALACSDLREDGPLDRLGHMDMVGLGIEGLGIQDLRIQGLGI